MSAKTIDLNVTMSEISLSTHALDNLASEFYGFIPAIAGSGDESNIVRIRFDDLVHPDIKTTIKADDCVAGMRLALDSFRVAPSADPSI